METETTIESKNRAADLMLLHLYRMDRPKTLIDECQKERFARVNFFFDNKDRERARGEFGSPTRTFLTCQSLTDKKKGKNRVY